MAAQNPPKSIKAKNGEEYTRTYFSYNYGSAQNPYFSEALFELQICKGVVKRNKKGALKLNLTVVDKNDLTGMTKVDKGMAAAVEKYKNLFGLFDFTVANAGGFRGCFFYPRVEGTGQLIEGASPIVSLKHNEKSTYKYCEMLKNPDGSLVVDDKGLPAYKEIPIDYKTLEGKELICGVVINPRDIYRSAGMPVPQLFVRSCMIMSMSDKGEVEHTKSDIVRSYLAQNPEMLNTLADQIAKMKVGQADNLFAKPASAPPQGIPSFTSVPGQSTPAAPSFTSPPSFTSTPGVSSPQFTAPPTQQPAYSQAPQFNQTPGQAPQFNQAPGQAPQFNQAPGQAPQFNQAPQFGQQSAPSTPSFSQPSPLPQMPQMPTPQVTPNGTLDLNAFLQQQAAGTGFVVNRM